MSNKFLTEREGQIAFFDNYHIDYEGDASILVDNTDGVYNGNLMEFKLNINDVNKVLFQAIKYLSKMRIKGESVPATILLIDLNGEKAYQYNSMDYYEDIHKVYYGSASIHNEGFVGGKPKQIYQYSEMMDSGRLKKVLKAKKNTKELYIPIRLNEDCILGWAERYYRENPKASKGDFLGDEKGQQVKIIGEIRKPRYFKGLICPYEEETNEKFKYLMDCLNDRLSKKDLGAFYTPKPYCDKSAELVEMAVKRALNAGKKDYIILDRCAGTGNLEESLIGRYDRNGSELISHCIVSTYEYYEYKVLNERIGDLVRDIIPPSEDDVEYDNGKVNNADAMSEEFINNPIIQQYLEDEDCAIILYENPPYRDVTSNSTGRAQQQNGYVYNEMKKEISGAVLNELTNRFVWSGFKYYLRQSTDSYVLFGPAKYFKTCSLVNKELAKGYLFNRKHFHATESAITCILWNNIDSKFSSILLEAYDISNNDELTKEETKEIHKAENVYSKFLYDKRNSEDDKEDGICCNLDGTERIKNISIRVKKLYNPNIIGYIRASSFNFDALSKQLLRCGEYDGNGFFLRNDNYKEKLPLWVAKHIPLDNWYEKDIYATTSDGGDRYTKDKEFLKRCLIYTCLSNQNKCLSFDGSDGRRYQNELCFDTNKKLGNPIAYEDLMKTSLDKDEQELMSLWFQIYEEAKQTKEYNEEFRYGVYQITKELNTFVYEGKGKNRKKVYDYPQLNGDLDTLRTKLKEYYKTHITDKMFEYELIK